METTQGQHIYEIRRQNFAAFVRHTGRLLDFLNQYGHLYSGTKTNKLSFPFLCQLVKGTVPIGNRVAEKLEQMIGVPRYWLDQVSSKDKLSQTTVVSNHDIQHTLPAFDTARCVNGPLTLRDQQGIIHKWIVSDEWVKRNIPNVTSPKALCIVTGYGDSMLPLFNPGDPLIVDTSITTVEFDAVYFFRIGYEGFVKRLQRIPGEGIRVISANKAYETWTITKKMDFHVLGRVLKVWKSEEL